MRKLLAIALSLGIVVTGATAASAGILPGNFQSNSTKCCLLAPAITGRAWPELTTAGLYQNVYMSNGRIGTLFASFYTGAGLDEVREVNHTSHCLAVRNSGSVTVKPCDFRNYHVLWILHFVNGYVEFESAEFNDGNYLTVNCHTAGSPWITHKSGNCYNWSTWSKG